MRREEGAGVFWGKELKGVTEIEGQFMRALEEEQEFAHLVKEKQTRQGK